MSIPVEHTISMVAVDNPSVPYKFVVNCTCQFQALARTRLVADRWAAGHAHAQTVRGNIVIIGSMPPSVDVVAEPVEADGSQEAAEVPQAEASTTADVISLEAGAQGE